MNERAIGALDGAPPVFVDEHGTIRSASGDLTVGWCVVAEDRFHDPLSSTTVRRSYDGAVRDTAMRVGGGDVIHRVYGIGGGATVVEVENASPAAVGIGLVVEGDPRRLTTSRAAAQHGVAGDARAARALVETAATGAGPLPATRARRDEVVVGVWPIAHRTTLRAVIDASVDGSPREVSDGPGADDVRRSWQAQLRRGLRFEVDDRVLQAAIDAARIGVLVRAPIADAAVVRALEDWGFDDEAALAWERLRGRDRRALRRRRPDAARAWSMLEAALIAEDDAALLNAVHDVVIDDRDDVVDLFAGFPTAWLGIGVSIHSAPVRRGRVSVALRWHGDRPALLWEIDGAVELRSSTLASGWSTREPAGETLLPAVSAELLGFAGADAASSGTGSATASPIGGGRPDVGFD